MNHFSRNNVQAGLCGYCRAPITEGQLMCGPCGVKLLAENNNLRNQRKVAGLCPCGKKSNCPFRFSCEDCAKDNLKRQKKNSKKLKRENRCARCHKKPRVKNRTMCEGCLCKSRQERKAWSIRLKAEVMAAYGGPACRICGETNIQFLAIDHIHGGGNKHRSTIDRKSGYLFYQWLKVNKFPPGYQVLCHNHNFARTYNPAIDECQRKVHFIGPYIDDGF